jgi:hypothetical protein
LELRLRKEVSEKKDTALPKENNEVIGGVLMNEDQYIVSLDKLLNRFIFEAKKFVWYAAFPYGLADLIKENVKSNKLTYDYEYFAFTKSTKTLFSIKELLKIDNNEDALMLVRSIFENYLSARYLNENPEKIDNFLMHPVMLAVSHYIVDEGIILNRNKEIIGRIENPSNFKIGKDKGYFYDFYGFLCTFSHSNFGISDCYLDHNFQFTLEKKNYLLLTRLFVIFVFTKIFEMVVTVEGEDFIDRRTEKNCYDLVEKSLKLQGEVFDFLILDYAPPEDDFYKYQFKKMREMFKAMKKSLKEELGSIKKST